MSLSERTEGAFMGALVVLAGIVLFRVVQRFRFVSSQTRRRSRSSPEMQSVVVKDYGSIVGRGEMVEVEVKEYPRDYSFGV